MDEIVFSTIKRIFGENFYQSLVHRNLKSV
jgi:hypothetical protein